MTAVIAGCEPIEMNYVIDGVFNAATNATRLFAGSDSGDVLVCSLLPTAAGLQITQSALGCGIHSDVVRCCFWNEAVRFIFCHQHILIFRFVLPIILLSGKCYLHWKRRRLHCGVTVHVVAAC